MSERVKCNHWWRKRQTFFDTYGCKKCLDKIEFRFDMAMNHMVKGTFDLFEKFQKLPKEVQDNILSKMDLGSIHTNLNFKLGGERK